MKLSSLPLIIISISVTVLVDLGSIPRISRHLIIPLQILLLLLLIVETLGGMGSLLGVVPSLVDVLGPHLENK